MSAETKNDYDHILAEVRALLAPYARRDQVIEPETRLVDDLGLDSVQAMELIMALEDRFDASIPVNFLPEVQSVDDLVTNLQPLLP